MRTFYLWEVVLLNASTKLNWLKITIEKNLSPPILLLRVVCWLGLKFRFVLISKEYPDFIMGVELGETLSKKKVIEGIDTINREYEKYTKHLTTLLSSP